MEDFLRFKKMIVPMIIQIIFWVGTAACVLLGLGGVIGGLGSSYGGGQMVVGGLLTIFLGPLVVRIYCELLIVIFSINDTLTQIKHTLENK